MNTLPGRIGELEAQHVMTRSVITLGDDDTLTDAVEKLKSHHITGAPVIDGAGKLVGILSISDLYDRAVSEDALAVPLSHERDTTSWDLFDRAAPLSDEHGVQTVGSRMSRNVTSVMTDALLVDVARAMCDGHWHRVPVIDAKGKLTGIISTMDVLAALVNIADEAEA